MKYKLLGTTGVKVSELCFGTMSFGGDADLAEAHKMYKAGRDKGINFFDCADIYNNGKAEEILGELMQSERDNVVITSKCFGAMGKDINAQGANRRHITRAVEASLRRLKTDRLDILFMHKWDRDTPLEETLRALENLVHHGKVLYLGVSNYAAWQIATALRVCERHGWPRIDVLQPMYNLVKRQAEVEIFPLAQAENLGVISYSPVGGGLLSGKYSFEAKPNTGRLVSNDKYKERYGEHWMLETAIQFSEFAKSRGLHPVSLAVAWAAGHPAVTCPIIGARSLEQLKPSLDALSIDMTKEFRAEISALSRTPAPAHDRLDEQ